MLATGPQDAADDQALAAGRVLRTVLLALLRWDHDAVADRPAARDQNTLDRRSLAGARTRDGVPLRDARPAAADSATREQR
jgi:hypothetical protein